MKIIVHRNDVIKAVCDMLRLEYSVEVTGEIKPIMAEIVLDLDTRGNEQDL